MSDEAAYSQDEFGDPHGLPWRVAPWGDGSSDTGNSNIISDRWQVVIASEMPTETAEFIVASVNQIERLRAALVEARDDVGSWGAYASPLPAQHRESDMSDDLVEKLRWSAASTEVSDELTAYGTLMDAAAAEIERLRAALRTSHMQLASKMAGKSALSDEKHMSILQAALSPLPRSMNSIGE